MVDTSPADLALVSGRDFVTPPPADTRPAPRVAAFKAEDLAALTPEQRSAFADSLRKAGHDTAAVEQALTGQPAVKPAEVVDTRAGGAHSEREQAALEAGLAGVPAYLVDLRGLFVGRREDTATARALDGELRTALSAWGIPAAMSRGVAEAMLKGGDEWQAIRSEPERQLYLAHQRSTVEKITGLPFEEVLTAAASITGKTGGDAVKTLIARRCFERAEVLIQLHAHATRQAARGR
jgi:hypothetical protein